MTDNGRIGANPPDLAPAELDIFQAVGRGRSYLVDDSTRAKGTDISPPGGVPLDLGPLLSPYKRHKRLSVRVERLPHKARLSEGRNNGDGTWSLSMQELDGLLYLPPKGLDEAHTLAIRVISLDGDSATTLTQVDYPVLSDDELEEVEEFDEENSSSEASSASNVVALSGSMARARKRARDKFDSGEIAAPDTSAAQEDPDQGVDPVDLKQAQARATELEEKVAELSLQLEVAADKAAASKEDHNQEISKLKKQHADTLRAEVERAEARFAKKLEGRLKEARAEWDRARDKWEAEQTHTRQKIKETKSGATKRAVEDALSKARKDWEKEARDRLSDAEAKAKKALDEALERSQEKADAAMAKAMEKWQKEEAARLDAAEKEWRARSDKALEEAAARLERAEAALAEAKAEPKPEPGKDTELRRLRDTLAETQATLAEQETALTDAHYEIERLRGETLKKAGDKEIAAARKTWERELESHLAEATKEAKAEGLAEGLAEGKAAGIAEGKALGHEDGIEEGRAVGLAKGIEQGRAEAKAEAKAEAEAEAADSLKESRAAWQAEMNERLEEAQKHQQAEIDNAVAHEKKAWKDEEQDRLDAAEERWREKSSETLAEATKRYEKAEAKLAEARHAEAPPPEPDDSDEIDSLREELAAARAAAEAAHSVDTLTDELGDSGDVDNLRKELAAAQAALADADAEFAQMRAKLRTELEKAKEGHEEQIEAALREAEATWKEGERQRILAARVQWRKEARSAQARDAITKLAMMNRKTPAMRLLIRGGAIAACLIVAAVLYFWVVPEFKGNVLPSVIRATDNYVPPSHISNHSDR